MQEKPRWNIIGMEDILKAETQRGVMPGHHEGIVFRSPDLEIGVIPEEGFTRIVGRHFKLDYYSANPPDVTEHGILFNAEDGSSTMRIGSEGDIQLLHHGNLGKTEQPSSPAVEEPSSLMSEPPSAEGTPAAVPGKERQPRIEVFGNVGTSPRFRTTASGKDVLEFSIAEHPDKETTAWHNIVAFDQRARDLRETLQKGEAVGIIGYPHERVIPGKDGKPDRTVREIYMTGVKRR
jgi:hypothetical protein